MQNNNKIKLIFPSFSCNEAFARNVVACFVLNLNPSVSEIADIKTAVSEAVTNCIVHAYPNTVGQIELDAEIIDRVLHINICDNGIGIEDVDNAMQPFYTTKSDEERSGMGFSIMKSFMDEINVVSLKDSGTRIYMKKIIKDDKRETNA